MIDGVTNIFPLLIIKYHNITEIMKIEKKTSSRNRCILFLNCMKKTGSEIIRSFWRKILLLLGQIKFLGSLVKIQSSGVFVTPCQKSIEINLFLVYFIFHALINCTWKLETLTKFEGFFLLLHLIVWYENKELSVSIVWLFLEKVN